MTLFDTEVNATFYRHPRRGPELGGRDTARLPVRRASWFDPAVYRILADHGVALVIGDHPERPFQTHDLTTEWTFIRFHYGRRGRRGSYSDGELETWAGRITEWRKRIEAFAYFNNDWGGFAVNNGVALKQRLGG